MTLPMGRQVLLFGVLGLLFSVAPAALLLLEISVAACRSIVVLPVLWASLVGIPFTYYWSKALHERIDQLKSVAQESDDDGRAFPRRVTWIPAWIGLFERGVYCLLVGADVAGAATFIGAWIALKLAGGWQIWSKGTTYGRAIFFAGLLGNLMSAVFGIIGGLVVHAWLPQLASH